MKISIEPHHNHNSFKYSAVKRKQSNYKMKKYIIPVLVLILGACHEIREDKNGRTIKVNKITGEVLIIDGNKIVKPKTNEDIIKDAEVLKNLESIKTWDSIQVLIGPNPNATLKTKWSDGFMYYQLFIDNNLRGLGGNNAGFTVEVSDQSGFQIDNFIVPLSTIIANLGADNKTIVSMEYKGKQALTSEAYKKISGWNIMWHGF